MKIQNILSKSIVHIIALALFAAISAALFYPELQGKSMRKGDVVNFEGQAKDIKDEIAQSGETPHWSSRMFGGMPSYTLVTDSGMKMSGILSVNSSSSGAWMIFMAMTSFYLMLLLMGTRPYLAIAGAVGYGLSTYFPIIIGAGHIIKMWALYWVPALIGSIWYTFNRRLWLGAGLSALFAAMLIGAGHHQITYYFLTVILSLVVYQGIRYYRKKAGAEFIKRSVVLLGAALLAVGTNIIPLYYTADYAKVSTRGGTSELATPDNSDATAGGLDRSYITAWSYGKAETFNLFIPNFEGGGRDFKAGGEVDNELKNYQTPKDYYQAIPSYHGTQPFTEGPVYIGAVIVMLAIFALCVLPRRQKWWILIPTMLALVLSWGHNFAWFTDLFIDYVPLYNKFRVPSMILVVVEWALPLLAVLGLTRLVEKRHDKQTLNALRLSVAIAGGFALFSAVVLPSMMDFSSPSDAQMPESLAAAMLSERASLLSSDAWRSLLYVVLTGGVIWLYIKNKITKVSILGLSLAALVCVDLFGVDKRYVKADEFVSLSSSKAIEMTPADKEILKDTGDFRVADFTRGGPFNSSAASYFYRSIGGYHAAKMLRYQDLIDEHLSQMNMNAYNMLNTRYFITQEGDVVPNEEAIGSAVILDSIMWVSGAKEEIEALGNKDFDPKRVGVIDEKYRAQVGNANLSTRSSENEGVTLDDFSLEKISYTAKLTTPRVVLFSEIYHHDWHVRVDGVAAEAIPIDYVLRGVVVPEGEHKIEWEFVVPHHGALKTVTAISTIAIFLLLGMGVALALKQKHEEENDTEK